MEKKIVWKKKYFEGYESEDSINEAIDKFVDKVTYCDGIIVIPREHKESRRTTYSAMIQYAD